MKKFWKWVRNKTPSEDGGEGERTLFLNGAISEDDPWLDDDVTPALFKSDLEAGSGDITVWINSPGGDCFAAAQIYNMLTDYKGKVTVKIDGLAASAASVIAMAGDRVLVSPVSMLFIHNPATMAAGDRGDMQQAIEMLDSVKDSIINAYAAKTGLSRSRLSKLMDNETWIDARMAVQLGFADEVMTRPGMKRDADDPDEEEASEQGDPDEQNSPEEGDEKSDPDEGNGMEADPDKKKPSGMLYSSRQMAAAFTNKVKKHYEAVNKIPTDRTPEIHNSGEGGSPKPEVPERPEGRSADALMERLNLLHSTF